MREILFRGKRKDNGEWVYGDFDQYNDTLTYIRSWVKIVPYLEAVERNVFPIQKETVGQYTGLTDKNGKKIFEGDIVRTVYDGIKNIFVVVWDNEELDFKATNGKENYGPGGFEYLPCCEEVKVIGNIYDNPELIK